MKRQGTRLRGFTLPELLVVIAIIALLAGITIPTLVKSGAFQKEYVSQGGRTLYNMLRAAEFYAATYNVETCLAYAAETQVDSKTGLDVIVARSVGVFRRATDAELNAWTGLDPYTPVFVPVGETDLTEFQPGVCVLGDPDTSVDPPEYFDFWEPFHPDQNYSLRGLTPVHIRTEEGVLVEPHEAYPFGADHCWAAHIFSPAGYVVAPTPQERLVMNVGPTPSSDLDDRFIDPEEVPLVPIDPVPVQISKSSARIKLVEPD